MKENYLHLIWEKKRLPFHQMKLVDGSDFEVIDPGTYNRSESGPDFLNARIKIDGMIWVGSVEIHVAASDWIKHNHQQDEAYNNVVLHVVWDNDKTIVQNERVLHCLELKGFLDQMHYRYFKDYSIDLNIPCSKLLIQIDSVYLQNMIGRSVVDKLERKYHEILQMCGVDDNEILLRLLARSFGTKVNQHPFDELAVRLSHIDIRILNRAQKKRLIIQLSGLFDSNNEIDLYWKRKDIYAMNPVKMTSLNPYSWKCKGLRPTSFPDTRIQQFAEVVSKMDFHLFMNPLDAQTTLELIHFQFKKINDSILDKKLKMSNNFIDLVVINCFVPFLFWIGKRSVLPHVCENALDLLSLVKAEDNHIINAWRKIGVSSRNAFDSQGLIELYNSYCVKKKCLTCAIGSKILNV